LEQVKDAILDRVEVQTVPGSKAPRVRLTQVENLVWAK
jgi:hypothetical protein